MGAPATAGYGTGTSQAISVRGAISEMGIRRQWPLQKRPSYETGETGGRVICLARPNSRMRTNIGETCQHLGGFHQREAPGEGHLPFGGNGHRERKA